MPNDQRYIHRKLRALRHAEATGSVSQGTCDSGKYIGDYGHPHIVQPSDLHGISCPIQPQPSIPMFGKLFLL